MKKNTKEKNGKEMKHLGYCYGCIQKALEGAIEPREALDMIRASFEKEIGLYEV